MSDLVKIASARVTDIQQTHWEGCERDHRECLIQRMADEIERLTAEIERLETDVRKLDFLELNGIGCDKIGGLGYSVWINGVRYDGDTARNAIDAAMRGSDE